MNRRIRLNKFKKPKDVVIIYYQWWAGNSNRGMWTSELNGEVMDYHKKQHLINDAEKNGREWMVIRYHKKQKGMITIMKYVGKKIQFSK